SVNWGDDDDDEQNIEDDIDILSSDNISTFNDSHVKTYSGTQNFYQLTYTSDDTEGQSVDEHDISELLDTLILHIEQMILD
ncbi:unnamed protein product, partial [Rotaria magnacalcarata]